MSLNLNLLDLEDTLQTILKVHTDESTNTRVDPMGRHCIVDPLRDDRRLDQLSDVSLDSGVNLSLDQDLTGTTADVDSLDHSPPTDTIDDSEDESEYLSSDFSDHDDFSDNFVSYRFDDYPDEVFCDVDVEPLTTTSVRRRSSVINPAEVYVTDKQCHCDVVDQIILRQSVSIKSRL